MAGLGQVGSVQEALADLAGMAARTAAVFVGFEPAHSAARPAPLRNILLVSAYDAVPIVTMAMAVASVGILLDRVGLWVAITLMDKKARKCKLQRFAESFSELVYYSFGLCLILRVTGPDADWFWPSGWGQGQLMNDGRNQRIASLPPYTVPAEHKFYLLMELGWYLQAMMKVCLCEKKKDFWAMLAHHFITSSLILGTFVTGYVRGGIVVLGLHNCFDPFLHLAKCANYVGFPIIPDISFAVCAVAFAVSRLFYYPKALYSVWLGVRSGEGGALPSEYGFVALLSTLLPLHIFWFYLILLVLRKALLSAGVKGDVREDTDSEVEAGDDRISPLSRRRSNRNLGSTDFKRD